MRGVDHRTDFAHLLRPDTAVALQFADHPFDRGVAVVILAEPVAQARNAGGLEVHRKDAHGVVAHPEVRLQVVVARVGKPDVAVVEDRKTAQDGLPALGDVVGHPRGEKPGDAVGRKRAVLGKLLETEHVDLLALHHRSDAVGRDGRGAETAEPEGVERGDADVMGTLAVEIGQLDHRRNIPQIERQRRGGHQRNAPLAAEKPPDERREVQRQDDGHQQCDGSPEVSGFRRDERRAPAHDGCRPQQCGKGDAQNFQQAGYGFSAHKACFFDPICLFHLQR